MLPGAPVNRGGSTPDTSSMPIGRTCRSCGAALPARVLLLAIAVGGAAAAWLSLDDVARYVWAAVAIVGGAGIFLSTWNDL